MNRWQEIIYYFDMTAEWIQVIFAGFALFLAWDYLKQHKKKAQLDRNADLATSIIKNLYSLQRILQEIYNKPGNLTGLAFFNQLKIDDVPEEIQWVYGDLAIIFSRQEQRAMEVDNLVAEISTSCDFIKKWDSYRSLEDRKIINLAYSLRASLVLIRSRINFNFETVQSISKFQLEDEFPTKKDRLRRLAEIKKEYRIFIPKSYFDKEFRELKEFRECWEEMKTYLKTNYIP